MASTAGAAALKRAVMCNGANIAFCKQSYLKFNDGLNLNISSGDDMFLLFNFKKEFAESILFLKSMDAIVFTNPPENLFEFFRQRLRWASKSKRYSDVDAIYLTWLVFVTNLSFFPLSILCLLNDSWLWVLFVLFFLKTMVDYTLVISFSLFFKKQKVLILLPFLTILYPFYVGIIGILSFILPIHWKGRLIRT